MRHRYNLFYYVDRYDDKCWWQDGKWRSISKIDQSRPFSNGPMFHKKNQAIRCLNKCPPGSTMTQFFYVHGKRYCNEYEVV